MIPPHTIIEASEARNYNFFLQQKNFLKVVDTLEKFQEGMVDVHSPAGKEFVQFKRSLYQLYEVKQRSILEHEVFSLNVDRRNLNSLY